MFTLYLIWSIKLKRNFIEYSIAHWKGMKILHGKQSGYIPHRKLPWPWCYYVNPHKYLCCWVTKREPSTRMVTSCNEYINLEFIEQTISEKGMMELLYVIPNQTWNCLPGNTYYPCALLMNNNIKGSDKSITNCVLTLLTTVTSFLFIIKWVHWVGLILDQFIK